MELLINSKTTEYSVISICTILLFPLHSTDFIDGTMPETPQLMSSKNGLEKPVISGTLPRDRCCGGERARRV